MGEASSKQCDTLWFLQTDVLLIPHQWRCHACVPPCITLDYLGQHIHACTTNLQSTVSSSASSQMKVQFYNSVFGKNVNSSLCKEILVLFCKYMQWFQASQSHLNLTRQHQTLPRTTTIDLKKHQNVEWQGTQTIFYNYTYFPEKSLSS